MTYTQKWKRVCPVVFFAPWEELVPVLQKAGKEAVKGTEYNRIQVVIPHIVNLPLIYKSAFK